MAAQLKVHPRLLLAGLGLSSLLLLSSGLTPGRAFARTEQTETARLVSDQELQELRDRLEQLLAHLRQLSQALEEIKRELAIVKVRVTD
jgi:hypothetical protein